MKRWGRRAPPPPGPLWPPAHTTSAGARKPRNPSPRAKHTRTHTHAFPGTHTHTQKQALDALLVNPSPPSAAFPLGPLSLLSLASWDPSAAAGLVRHPEAGLLALAAGAVEAQESLIASATAAAGAGDASAAAWVGAASLKRRLAPRLAPPPPGLVGGAEAEGGNGRRGRSGSGAGAALPPLSIGRLRAGDAGRLVVLRGTLVTAGPVRALEAARTFECARCGHLVSRRADLAAQRAPAPPRPAEGCAGTARGGGGGGAGGCKGGAWLEAGAVSTAAAVLGGGSALVSAHPPELVDYQEARLQARPGGGGSGGWAAATGARAPCVALILTGADLAGTIPTGSEATVIGHLVTRWSKPPKDGERCAVELAVVVCGVAVAGGVEGVAGSGLPAAPPAPLALPAPPAHLALPDAPGAACSIAPSPLSLLTPADPAAACQFSAFWAVHAAAPLAARDAAVRAVAPHLHGLADAKLAIALALVGGHGPAGGAGQQGLRGDVHVLLTGDPATGKSALLRAASSLAGRRGVAVVARATSAAGLTAAAVKDASSGLWALEPGALVLADGGLAALDGLDAFSPADRAALHEAMEQQAVSVAKAGVVATLPTRCAVVAAAGPLDGKGRAGGRAGGGGGAAPPPLEAPLLSRFDLALDLRDARLPAWDAGLADHKLGKGRRAQRAAAGAAPQAHPHGPPTTSPPPWDAPALRSYIAWARSRPPPALSPVAERIILLAYAARRAAAGGGGAGDEEGWEAAGAGGGGAPHPPTVRALEALARVATAHARLCGGKGTVDAIDAVVAVRLTALGAGVTGGGGGGGGGGLGPGFPSPSIPPARDPLTACFPTDPDAAAALDVAAAMEAVRAAEEQAELERAVAGQEGVGGWW